MNDKTASEDQKPADAQPNAHPPAGAQNTEEQSVPYSRFKEINAAKKALEDRLAQIEREAKAKAEAEETAKRAAEAEQGNFKTAYEKSEAELKELRAVAERAKAYEAKIKTMLERRLESVPVHIKSLLAQMQPEAALDWLDENAEQLQPRKAPETDAGKNGDRKDGTFAFSDKHLDEVAAKFNIPRRK